MNNAPSNGASQTPSSGPERPQVPPSLPESPAPTIAAAESPGGTPGRAQRVRYLGDYELLEEIAHGGMGTVWKARQISLNRVVAVKMILAGQLATQEHIERFRREANAAANLQHPNIVAIHEIGQHEGQQYFSMDYVDGCDLAALVRERPLAPERAARYVRTIAEAVHFAHQRGTLHRDLKPQNVLIDAHDQPRITDFGLARTASGDSSLTFAGSAIGTPSYMPPEQAAGGHDQVGPHSDVYSLGAMFYELLTGRPPFRGDTALATMQQVIASDPVPPRRVSPAVPAELETICLKCMEKSPQRRYATARDLAEELGRFERHEPIRARPLSAARRVEQWARRHPNYLLAVAALLFLGITCLAYVLWEQNQYLVWVSAHPGHSRAAGVGAGRLQLTEEQGFLLFLQFLLLFLVQMTINYRQTRRLSWRQRLEVWGRERPIVPPFSPPTLLAFGILGAGEAAYALFLLRWAIHAYVWEGIMPATGPWLLLFFEGIRPAAGPCLLLFFVGVLILKRAIREHRAALYGRGSLIPSPLGPRVERRILDALRAGALDTASETYRRAMHVTFEEAEAAVKEIALKAGSLADAGQGKQRPSLLRALGRRRGLTFLVAGVLLLLVGVGALILIRLSGH